MDRKTILQANLEVSILILPGLLAIAQYWIVATISVLVCCLALNRFMTYRLRPSQFKYLYVGTVLAFLCGIFLAVIDHQGYLLSYEIDSYFTGILLGWLVLGVIWGCYTANEALKVVGFRAKEF